MSQPNKVSHRVAITGASGTLGRNFLEQVGRRPDFRVLALLRHDSRELSGLPAVETVRVDNFSRPHVGALISRFEPTAIVHCAATGMSFPHSEWFELIRFNVDLTVDLCECAAALGNCHFVFISTGMVYREEGRPLKEEDALGTLHPYGASKAAADLLVRAAAAEFAVPLTVLRPFSFTGLWDDRTRLFSSLLRGAVEGRELDLSDGTQVRNHCSARDIAAGIVRALETGHSGGHSARIFNLGSGRSLPLRPLIEGIIAELNLGVQLRFGARPMGRFEPRHLVANIDKAVSELGWYPRHNLAHAVWELAHESFSALDLREPEEATPTP